MVVPGLARDIAYPEAVAGVCREGLKKGAEVLAPFVLLLWREARRSARHVEPDDLPAEDMIGLVPCWAYDMHVREGNRAMARFLETDSETTRWASGRVPRGQRVRLLGWLLFAVESALVTRRLKWDTGNELRRMAEIECQGLDPEEAALGLRLLRQDLPILNQARRHWPGPTSDNSHLSRPTMADLVRQNPGLGALSPSVRAYLRDAMSANTRAAYQSDLRHFLGWGGALPASDAMLADYLAEHAGLLSVATLVRRLASISRAHRALPNPSGSGLVRATLRGIKRAHGRPQRHAKPLVKEDLFAVLAAMGGTLKDARDRALLLNGFAGGFRRSELIGIDCGDIETVRQGIVVHIRRSKTDQEGAGRKVGIPHGRTRWCPVTALNGWLERSGVEEGPVFRRVDRHGKLLDGRLSGEAVSLVIKARVAAVGLDPDEYSGHSLRAGLATSAAASGVSSWKIRQQTGHASDAMLARYIRDGELFVDNAAGRCCDIR